MNKLIGEMFDDRTIVVSGALGTAASTDVVSQLLLLNTLDPGADIKLYIDSTAGSLAAGFAICDTINCIASDVSTWAIGTVGSVATLVLCSGAAGKRYALPGSDIVLRQPSHEECLDERLPKPPTPTYSRWVADMVRVLAERTGQGHDIIARDLRKHHRLSAADSVTYGLVDHHATGGKYAPQAN
jgi:ATP-dependent Clp protease protease subunit